MNIKKTNKVLIIAATINSISAAYAENLAEIATLDTTQRNMANLIDLACPNQGNQINFKDRCSELKRAPNASETLDALQKVAPEQIPSQGISSTRASFNTIANRLSALRIGSKGFQVAGLTNANPVNLASLSPVLGGAAGDSFEGWDSQLGGFVNGAYNTGNIDSEFNQLGYNFNAGSINLGLDYRFNPSLVLGTAFTYMRSESSFDQNNGSLNSDSYTGALYGNYFATDNLYLDGIATFGSIDYDSTRRIDYKTFEKGPNTPIKNINTAATASPEGNQYSVSLGTGYNYYQQQWLVNPYAKINYIKLDVDSFSENGGAGWGMAFDKQTVESVTSTLGTQISYVLNTSWAVLIPDLHGEWHHQYEDSSRNIAVKFLGNTNSTTRGRSFDTLTSAPDRNYFMVGTGVSGTFAKGISAFLNYDALLGYRNIESHLFTLGARVEF